jgi:regulator of Ty1 transposition protein 103
MQVPHDGLTQKLQRLSQSQQSIESVSSFCIFYHKDARGVVAVWDDQFYKASAERRLALLYLANHILQEGRKKGPAFQEEFYRVLPKALAHIGQHGDDKARKAVARLVAVWEERRVFGSRHVKSWREVCGALTASDDGGSGAAAAKGGSSSKHAGGGSSKHTASGSGSSKQGAAAAAAAAAAVAATAAGLGPVGEALQKVKQCAAAAAASNKEFSSSWSQVGMGLAQAVGS